MKIVCSKAELNRVIGLAQSAASTKNVLPILTHLLFEADENGLSVTGTDLEIGLRVKTKVEVVQSGSTTLPAKKVAEIVRNLDEGDVELSVEGSKAKIKGGRANMNLLAMPAEDFPNFPGYRKEKSLALKSKVLADMVKRTAFSVSQDETRYILQGGLLSSDGKKARMVTTDGHRLSYIEQPLEASSELLQAVIPSKALGELGRVLQNDDSIVTAYFADNHIFFEMGELTLYSRLLDGQFPNYEQVIPKKNEHTLLAEVAPLAAVINRMSLLAADKGNSIKFHLSEDGLKVTASTADLGEGDESLDVEYQGTAMTVAFNARYLMDVLKVLGSERVEIKLSTPLSPTLITPVGVETGARYVVMPMRA
jgi:DNA polymerase-3 subunit beta